MYRTNVRLRLRSKDFETGNHRLICFSSAIAEVVSLALGREGRLAPLYVRFMMEVLLRRAVSPVVNFSRREIE